MFMSVVWSGDVKDDEVPAKGKGGFSQIKSLSNCCNIHLIDETHLIHQQFSTPSTYYIGLVEKSLYVGKGDNENFGNYSQ